LKILFDEGVPRPLKDVLASFTIDTVQSLGLAGRSDSEILHEAETAGHDVFVTTDKNLRHQVNLSRFRISIYELPTTSWPRLKARAGQIRLEIEALSRA
jgi:predicted nuclease of predicted toxin-antitoxin system